MIFKLAEKLMEAEANRKPISPFAEQFNLKDVDSAYLVQNQIVENYLKAGQKLAGYKVGLTSLAIQSQLGIDEPVYGPLYADRCLPQGSGIKMEVFIAPKIEAEIAILIEKDIDEMIVTPEVVLASARYAFSALEIADSRIVNWKANLFEAILDSSMASRFMLSETPVLMDTIDLSECEMELRKNGVVESTGIGSNCLGHPLSAAAWLGRKLALNGSKLRAGDIIMTGALGPMVDVEKNDHFESRISGFEKIDLFFN